jgi:hypothetical protein
MTTFLVTVACLAHLKACPIPHGIHRTVELQSKSECIAQTHAVIKTLGFQPADFRVECREK